VASRVEASFAVTALVAGHMMGNKNSVAHLDALNFGADFVDDACCLVTQNYWSLRNSVPFDNVAAAYAACHNLKQSLVFADFRDRHFLDADIMVVVVNGGKQEASPKRSLAKLCQL
jgi:hypothetical protein